MSSRTNFSDEKSTTQSRNDKNMMKQIFRYLGPVHMIPGQVIATGQLTDPGANFASVHGLTPVTVHTSFLLPRGSS